MRVFAGEDKKKLWGQSQVPESGSWCCDSDEENGRLSVSQRRNLIPEFFGAQYQPGVGAVPNPGDGLGVYGFPLPVAPGFLPFCRVGCKCQIQVMCCPQPHRRAEGMSAVA